MTTIPVSDAACAAERQPGRVWRKRRRWPVDESDRWICCAGGERAKNAFDAVTSILLVGVERCWCLSPCGAARRSLDAGFDEAEFHFALDDGSEFTLRVDDMVDRKKVRNAVFRRSGKMILTTDENGWQRAASALHTLARLAYCATPSAAAPRDGDEDCAAR